MGALARWLQRHGLVLLTFAALAFPGAAEYLRIPLYILFGIAALLCILSVHLAWWIIDVRNDVHTRISHAIEHAALAVLENDRVGNWGGNANRDHFIIRIPGKTDVEHLRTPIRQATEHAIRRLELGDTELAITPLCGTVSNIKGVIVTALITASAIPLLLGGPACASILALLYAVRTAAEVSQFLGIEAQRRFTITTEFESVRTVDVTVGETKDDAVHMRVGLEIVPRATASCSSPRARAAHPRRRPRHR